jgi:hypothetical protein
MSTPEWFSSLQLLACLFRYSRNHIAWNPETFVVAILMRIRKPILSFFVSVCFWLSLSFFWVICRVPWIGYQPLWGQVRWWRCHLKTLDSVVGPTLVWSLPFGLVCLVRPARGFSPADIALRITVTRKSPHHKVKDQPPRRGTTGCAKN